MCELPTCLVPDSSVIIDRHVSTAAQNLISNERDSPPHVVIPEAVVNELEAQANSDLHSGWAGLAELQALADLDDEGVIKITYAGEAVRPSDIAGSKQGDIDAIIRQLADDNEATLLTSDAVQAETAQARAIDVELISPKIASNEFAIERFFDEDTMSVHLKTGTTPKAKTGALDGVEYVPISDEPTSANQMNEWTLEIEEVAQSSPEGFVELSEPGMDIIQLRDYRIAIARPPFADAIEITAVKPIAKTTLEDYNMPDGLTDRFTEQKRGILISGSPGAGKSTFAQAVGEYLNDNGVVVKTMEQPRDLQVGPEITQYTALAGEMGKTADSLLLVRPDYTIYDEVRKTDDFDVFADMRLAGVGMLGVVHATRAIDALQRLVGRVELGLIPQIVDTVVYVESGNIHTVYDITTVVKVPDGMNSEDLARPVIQVQDYETGEPVFEVYTFNRQVVTVALGATSNEQSATTPEQATSTDNLENAIQEALNSVASGQVEVEADELRNATVYVEKSDISRVIGENGSQITDVENKFNASIDVRIHRER